MDKLKRHLYFLNFWVPINETTTNTRDMDIFELNPDNLQSGILSSDPAKRNQAFRLLYESRQVKAKIREWADFYGLKGMANSDVLQEAIILLDKTVREGKFKGESRVETFLLGICKNIIRDGSKKASKVILADSFSDNLTDEGDIADNNLMLMEQSDTEMRRDDALKKAMSQLTEKCQENLRLYYFDNQAMAAVAAARGLANAEQAKKAVSRCRQSLREIIAENTFFQSTKNLFS